MQLMYDGYKDDGTVLAGYKFKVCTVLILHVLLCVREFRAFLISQTGGGVGAQRSFIPANLTLVRLKL